MRKNRGHAAARLAQRHPLVFVAFGCHPKSAHTYNDKLEQARNQIIEKDKKDKRKTDG